MKPIESLMRHGPLIPVLVIDDLARAQVVAEALVAGGLAVLEVTLRTRVALEVIRAMKAVEGAIVGAGTVIDAAGLDAALAAGADFIVSPGLTEGLARAAIAAEIPFLPGVATASDIMRGLDLGLRHFKFFPAEAAGGTKALRALLGPFGELCICPTGGITAQTMADWLAIEQVPCVGGTWLVQRDTASAEITRRASEARSHARGDGGRAPA
jgi:2-dehydro-3-deoxyphosphogluconate aldolase/(4S)-4-hydroxy-2-oxoglutarate aldolase